MPRTFIAVRIPRNPELARLHRRLSSIGDSFRPAALDQLHLTLKFLGETHKRQVPEISGAIRTVAGRHPTHSIALRGVGAFPGPGRPSVVWVGVHGGQTLHALAAALDSELAPFGFVPETRPFHPHVTMLRIKARPPSSLFSLLEEFAATDFGAVRVESLEFLQSDLQPGGPRYTLLSSARLAPHAATENRELVIDAL